MIQLKYKNWDEVSIDKYEEILQASEQQDDLARTVGILASLTDQTVEDIENMNIEEMSLLVKQTGWVNSFDFPKDSKPKTVKIQGEEYTVTNKVSDMSVAQYADFQAYFGKTDKMEVLLSIFIIPKGHKYAEGYDIEELQEKIRKNISIVDSNSIIYFFLKSSLTSFTNTVTSLEKELKRAKQTEKKKEILEKIETIQERIQAIRGWH